MVVIACNEINFRLKLNFSFSSHNKILNKTNQCYSCLLSQNGEEQKEKIPNVYEHSLYMLFEIIYKEFFSSFDFFLHSYRMTQGNGNYF